jgi:hypothetical protein
MLDKRSEGPSPIWAILPIVASQPQKSRGGRKLRSLLANEREKLTWTYDRGHPMGAWKMANVASNKIGRKGGFGTFEKSIVRFVIGCSKVIKVLWPTLLVENPDVPAVKLLGCPFLHHQDCVLLYIFAEHEDGSTTLVSIAHTDLAPCG